MINTIGELSGKIYQTLETKDDLTVAKLKSQINADDFTLAAAIGWLAREDKIHITKAAKSVKLSLKR